MKSNLANLVKVTTFALALMAALAIAGCATDPVRLPAVGPNPYGSQSSSADGQLEVFSAFVSVTEGDNPTWKQHSAYYVYTEQRKLLKHVANTTGYYAEAPRVVALPAGRYLVKARAKDYFWVEVPVVIQSGKSTTVHLDESWKPADYTSKSKIAYCSAGYPIGWIVEKNSESKK